MNHSTSTMHLILVSFCLTATSFADEWPQFRGPNSDGHVASSHLPVTWSESKNVTWKTSIAGKGHSSPVIAGNQIWLTTAVTSELPPEEAKRLIDLEPNPNGLEIAATISLRAICIHRKSGRILQNIELFSHRSPGPVHSTNSYASPTPLLLNGRLFCHFGTYGSACIEVDSGRVIWRASEIKIDHQNGPGASPVLWRNLMIAHFDGIDSQSVAAIHIDDGRTVWRTARSGEMHEKDVWRKAYATPKLIEHEGQPLLISPAANWVYAYDPSDGREIWKASYGEVGFSTVPCPVIGHGLAYICTSFPRSRLLAVRYDGQGDVSDSHIAWSSTSQICKKPSLLLAGNELYVLSDAGILTCLDALTGEQIWRERIGGNYSASPILCDQLIYLFSQEGKATVLRAGRQFGQVAVNQLDASFMASPAAVDGTLFLRSETHLYRIDDAAKQTADAAGR